MNSCRMWIGAAVVILCAAVAVSHDSGAQNIALASQAGTKERARIVLSHALPKLDGNRLNVAVVEVNYGAGESSPPHSHPCAVIGYVVEGAIRSQVKGEPEMTYTAGESFYEAPNGVHLVSANASATKAARFVAYMLCDHDAPLSVDQRENIHPKGEAK
jgi:quercetin dioxygenase-like cupin family protein